MKYFTAIIHVPFAPTPANTPAGVGAPIYPEMDNVERIARVLEYRYELEFAEVDAHNSAAVIGVMMRCGLHEDQDTIADGVAREIQELEKTHKGVGDWGASWLEDVLDDGQEDDDEEDNNDE